MVLSVRPTIKLDSLRDNSAGNTNNDGVVYVEATPIGNGQTNNDGTEPVLHAAHGRPESIDVPPRCPHLLRYDGAAPRAPQLSHLYLNGDTRVGDHNNQRSIESLANTVEELLPMTGMFGWSGAEHCEAQCFRRIL